MSREIRCGRTDCNHHDRCNASCSLKTIAIDSKGQCVCYDGDNGYPDAKPVSKYKKKLCEEREAYEGA